MSRKTTNRIRAQVAVAAVAVAAGIVLAAPSPASANTCSVAQRVLDIKVTDDMTVQTVGGTIALSDGGGPRTCSGGTPTTSTIDGIRVVDLSPDDVRDELRILDPASFGPGYTPELAPNLSEIEWVINNGVDDDDGLRVVADPATATNWTVGTGGLNHNGDADSDVMGGPFRSVGLLGSAQSDRISAQGGAGTNGPLVAPEADIFGGEGNDNLHGGDGRDRINGQAGDDGIDGHGGDDFLEAQGGDDVVAGGAGTDGLSFAAAAAGVRFDLRNSGRQDTGEGLDAVAGIENVLGSNVADTLIGDDSANLLDGGLGDDTIDGRGGADELRGYSGVDTVTYADAPGPVNADLVTRTATVGGTTDQLSEFENLIGSPFADTLTGDNQPNRLVGGAGADVLAAAGGADRLELRDGTGDRASCGGDAGVTDTAIADRRGVDTVANDCESVAFAPESAPPGGGSGANGGGAAGSRDAAPVLSRLRLSPRRIGARGRTTLSFGSSEAARLSVRFDRLGSGRRARRAGTLTRSIRAGRGRVRLSARIGRRRLAPGRYRLTVTARDAAGNRSKARQLTLTITKARR